MSMNPLLAVSELGQSIWYDNIQRSLITSGELARMIQEDGLRGMTSNPTIFEKAITGSADYDSAIAKLVATGHDLSAQDIFYRLAIEDIQSAADIFRATYDASDGVDGMVSLEVSPLLARDTAQTIKEARDLAERVQRPNLMIKVPATREGLPAVEQLTADGLNINVTLLFSVERYREVAEAYLRGLERRLERGQPIDHITSVASFFISRVDSAVDKLLEQGLQGAAPAEREQRAQLQGKTAIANAKLAYQAYQEIYADPRFETLRAAGAKAQRLLWGSTGTKNPKLSDVLYVEELIGPETVNTVPLATYKAFKDHGKVARTLDEGVATAQADVAALHELGIDLGKVTQQLEDEGVVLFANSFNSLIGSIAGRLGMGSKLASNS